MTIRTCRYCRERKSCRYDKITNTFNHTQKCCIKCNRLMAADWYEENRERKLEYQRRYYEQNKKISV